jgi:Methyltransferase domain
MNLVHRIRRSLALRLTPDQPILLDYPIKPSPRYGYGKPSHPQLTAVLEASRPSLTRRLSEFVRLKQYLSQIPNKETAELSEPHWGQPWFTSLDAVGLYGMLCEFRPRRFIEVGSGNSTKFARRAMRDHSISAQLISIDPAPRAEVDSLCDSVIRLPLEEVDLTVFDQLEAGDFLFIDSSHRTFQNSDVTAVFLDLLPRLRAGVIVHFHDILWPRDYPPEWVPRYYSEQYLLGAYLLADTGSRIEILLPSAFVAGDAQLANICKPLLDIPGIGWPDDPVSWPHGIAGGSFWLRLRPQEQSLHSH